MKNLKQKTKWILLWSLITWLFSFSIISAIWIQITWTNIWDHLASNWDIITADAWNSLVVGVKKTLTPTSSELAPVYYRKAVTDVSNWSCLNDELLLWTWKTTETHSKTNAACVTFYWSGAERVYYRKIQSPVWRVHWCFKKSNRGLYTFLWFNYKETALCVKKM